MISAQYLNKKSKNDDDNTPTTTYDDDDDHDTNNTGGDITIHWTPHCRSPTIKFVRVCACVAII